MPSSMQSYPSSPSTSHSSYSTARSSDSTANKWSRYPSQEAASAMGEGLRRLASKVKQGFTVVSEAIYQIDLRWNSPEDDNTKPDTMEQQKPSKTKYEEDKEALERLLRAFPNTNPELHDKIEDIYYVHVNNLQSYNTSPRAFFSNKAKYASQNGRQSSRQHDSEASGRRERGSWRGGKETEKSSKHHDRADEDEFDPIPPKTMQKLLTKSLQYF
eukprot:Rmarinus@m.17864